eukprot:COSAG02_NODE_1438_length_12604_cov_27.849580_4_plen_61_part_00
MSKQVPVPTKVLIDESDQVHHARVKRSKECEQAKPVSALHQKYQVLVCARSGGMFGTLLL